MSEEEMEKIENNFQNALSDLISGIPDLTATETIMREQPMILLYKSLINKIERDDYLISKLQKENDLAKQSLKQNCDVFDKYNQLLVENQELKAKYDKALTDLVNQDYKIIYLNKVIDEMAKFIYKNNVYYNELFDEKAEKTENEIKEYFFKEVEND